MPFCIMKSAAYEEILLGCRLPQFGHLFGDRNSNKTRLKLFRHVLVVLVFEAREFKTNELKKKYG